MWTKCLQLNIHVFLKQLHHLQCYVIISIVCRVVIYLRFFLQSIVIPQETTKLWLYNICCQTAEITVYSMFWGVSQSHSPGWTKVHFPHFLKFPSIFPQTFFFFVLILPSGWATRPPGKAMATPLFAKHYFFFNENDLLKLDSEFLVIRFCNICWFFIISVLYEEEKWQTRLLMQYRNLK